MPKRLSNNEPLRRDDKKEVINFPLDDRFIFPVFDNILPLLGKYESIDSSCLLFYQNNSSEYNTMNSELIILRFSDTTYENDLKCAQKIPNDIR